MRPFGRPARGATQRRRTTHAWSRRCNAALEDLRARMNYLDRVSRTPGLTAGDRVRVALDVLEHCAALAFSQRAIGTRRVTVREVRVDSKGIASVPKTSTAEHLTTLLWEILAGSPSETDDTPWSDPAPDLHEDILASLASLSVRPPESAADLLARFAREATHLASTHQIVATSMEATSSVPLAGARSSNKTPVVPRDQSMPTIPAPPMTVQALVDLSAGGAHRPVETALPNPFPAKRVPPRVAPPKAQPSQPLRVAPAIAPRIAPPIAPRIAPPIAPRIAPPIAPRAPKSPFGKLAPFKAIARDEPSQQLTPEPDVGRVLSVSAAPRSADEAATDDQGLGLSAHVGSTPLESSAPAVEALAVASESPSPSRAASPFLIVLASSAPTALLTSSSNDRSDLVSPEHFAADSTFTDAEVPIVQSQPRRRRGWLVTGVSLGVAILSIVWVMREKGMLFGQTLDVGLRSASLSEIDSRRSPPKPDGDTDPAKTAPKSSDASKSDAAKNADAVKPDVVKPDAAKPDAAKPDAAKPDAAKFSGRPIRPPSKLASATAWPALDSKRSPNDLAATPSPAAESGGISTSAGDGTSGGDRSQSARSVGASATAPSTQVPPAPSTISPASGPTTTAAPTATSAQPDL